MQIYVLFQHLALHGDAYYQFQHEHVSSVPVLFLHFLHSAQLGLLVILALEQLLPLTDLRHLYVLPQPPQFAFHFVLSCSLSSQLFAYRLCSLRFVPVLSFFSPLINIGGIVQKREAK